MILTYLLNYQIKIHAWITKIHPYTVASIVLNIVVIYFVITNFLKYN
jgi:hypothetical protein